MDFFELLERRRSVRAFDSSVPLSGEALARILDCVKLAPSAGNLQSYRIVTVQSETVRRDLAQAAFGQTFVAEAPLVMVFCADGENASRKYGMRGTRLYSVQDATIACTFAMLAVTDMGFATVWVGAFDEDAVRQAVGINPSLRPVAMLPIGTPKEAPEARPRRPLHELVDER
jgi:nitroreductase